MPTTTTAPARRARTKLDRAALIDRALGLADAEGLDAVTIRRLADELGVTPMALYWHVDDKEALLDALADRLWSDVASSVDLEGLRGWRLLDALLDAMVAVLRRHPAAAALAPRRIVECEPGLALTEAALATLLTLGFDREQAASMAQYLLCATVMLVTSQPGSQWADPTEREDKARAKGIALAMLPPERYPSIVAVAPWLADCDDGDAYFERGVRTIAAGIRAQVPPRSRRARS